MKAFLLCKLTPGFERQALESMRAIEGVTDVYLVFGGWDVVLGAEADTMEKMSRLVVSRIRATPGVLDTMTLVTTHI